MADLYKNTLAAGASTTLAGITEHGAIVLGAERDKIKVEHDLDSGNWSTIAHGGASVINYVGTTVRITNENNVPVKIRVGQK